MRSAVGRQQQLDTQAAHSNLQSLRSSRPVLIWLLIAVLALATAAALTLRLRWSDAARRRAAFR